ncbi:MAG: outer membrane beta-barrel protein [Alphaproteobacteria bacterium]|nr:outer membrane beta-barrel protein [Alphaproteobacteria bacterium]
MKNIALSAVLAVFATTAANAGVYITPKISWNQVHIDESRDESKIMNDTWASYNGAKHETWSGHDDKLAPKFAVGYDFNTEKYGMFGIEAEYGTTSNEFKPLNAMVDGDGKSPNDSDIRTYKYDESTLSLNAKYGYTVYGVTPFLTAGVGYTIIDSTNNFRSGTYWWDTTDQERNISWNIGGGVLVPVSHNVALSLEYKYTDLGNVKYSNWMFHEDAPKAKNGIERHFDSSVDLYKHEILMGVKIAF